MRGLIEISGFAAIAVAAHLAIWPTDAGSLDGANGAGAGGAEVISVQASNASIAQMVETWDSPPEVPDVTSEMAPPAPPDIPTPPVQIAEMTPPSTMPDLALPDMPVIAQGAALPKAAQVPPTPEAKKKPAPKTKPAKAPRKTAKAKPAPKKAAKASLALQKRRAAGSGEGAVRGDKGAAKTASTSAAKQSSLLKKWGRGVHNRIVRRAPRGVGKGRAVVIVTVARDGRLLGVRLEKTSGNPGLDQQALSAAKRAGKLPAAPKGVNKAKHSFRVAISSR